MKIAIALIFAILIAAVLISGCVQQGPGTGGTGGGAGQITRQQAEDQAVQTVDQEMNDAIGNMSVDDVKNELLQG